MTDVLLYDSFGGFSPSFVATKQAGGSHMHQSQLAEFLAAQGLDVSAFHKGPCSEEGGVRYTDVDAFDQRGRVKTLIVIGNSALPTTCNWDRAYSLSVIDPRPVPHYYDHMRGKDITIVCVSEWQASLFRPMGFKTIVIPVPIPDEWYGMRGHPFGADFVCVSSWNKGARETIGAWDNAWGTLAVGSPYSHPDEAEDICKAHGVEWLGALTPRERWINAMLAGRAVARICTIGETFGVVDVAARAMGMSCYTLCTGDVGALREVGAEPFTDPAEWREAIKQRRPHPGGDAERFRLSRVLPQWLPLLGG